MRIERMNEWHMSRNGLIENEDIKNLAHENAHYMHVLHAVWSFWEFVFLFRSFAVFSFIYSVCSFSSVFFLFQFGSSLMYSVCTFVNSNWNSIKKSCSATYVLIDSMFTVTIETTTTTHRCILYYVNEKKNPPKLHK